MGRLDIGAALPGTASERVAAAIREWMFSLGLKPGDRLGREEDLADRFGVSRPTRREALRELSGAHLIRSTTGRGGGIFVAATGEASIGMIVSDSVAAMLLAESVDMHELVETRLLLEVPLAGMAAARAGDDDVAQLRRLLEAASGNRDDPDAMQRASTQLHAQIARIAGNQLSRAMVQWIGAVAQDPLFRVIRDAVVSAMLFDQLEAIVREIGRGDGPAAERATREHLVYLADVLAAVSPDHSNKPNHLI
jgi:GntR family transcriptional repressor for pyruvate dehydrogenase complex